MQNLRPVCLRLWPGINKHCVGSHCRPCLPHTLITSQRFPAVTRLLTHASRALQARTVMETPRAPFLSTLQQCLSLDSPWGFVIYRTAAYAPNDAAKWQAFQQKFNSMIQESFESAAGPEEEVAAARQGWTIRWEEKTNMAEWAAEDVKKHYEVLLASGSLPVGLSHPLCLMVTSAAIKSILDAPSPLPRYEYSSGGRGAPFVVAVDLADLDDEDKNEIEDERYKGHFNVSVQCLLDGLWPILIEQMCDVEELGRGVKMEEVWGM
ncbi:uncharacterized protein K460DRAFT_411731 [Cucurbitaria berberidis CBS 394.84]|uniref:Uncharacterized protein n=1 Tax=Cucurbitaria berberidis CBS 394.84 TaxID=1168544 RepID=A0A9P4GQJ1_9PLEO|nr:uncharacterized protein K460DRAFT_411731 [Cucurbitaria berberidis CBS 394.84]KAF1849932.1 hypothetical protein K460DRAFT_411731 [Cucurbitaria berberidis CBS 394.84]